MRLINLIRSEYYPVPHPRRMKRHLLMYSFVPTKTGAAGWNIITRRALSIDNVSILEIWMIMTATAVSMVAVIWYFVFVQPSLMRFKEKTIFPLMVSMILLQIYM